MAKPARTSALSRLVVQVMLEIYSIYREICGGGGIKLQEEA